MPSSTGKDKFIVCRAVHAPKTPGQADCPPGGLLATCPQIGQKLDEPLLAQSPAADTSAK
jgi:hypothetical protein